MGRLSGKTILVTGAASGMGRAALDLFAREGASLVAVDREERLLAEAVAALEAEAIAVVADVSDPKAVEAVFAEALEEFGRLHGVAHFAGVAHSALSWNLPLEAWEKVLRVNLTGSFLVARKAGEVLEEGGSLVLTGSVAGLGAFGLAHYAAGKLGVVGLARTLALELARKGVRVPGQRPPPRPHPNPHDGGASPLGLGAGGRRLAPGPGRKARRGGPSRPLSPFGGGGFHHRPCPLRGRRAFGLERDLEGRD
ncbi:(-)-trans-carveol dehydrogenase (plasmid) [Thermus thermophilus]|uniref:(-)-trans-carveol dehydrogenase n=1 Tax=Thermus thermophilus TaxID=274 RepID=A0A3P4AWC7_THETH|nr:(-)-trans-carveol dehydrogenase [Thermus thermophilus]